MDPLEPARNDENSGLSRRRISSILKAPRKSAGCAAPEHQENLVECPKPVEKRNSRRVSFAPANNVLLFSNDGRHASPVRSPLQDLTTTPATQHRVQITEDEIQQIAGMETLLNAPLHAPQKRDKVNFHAEEAFGEKTVMFSAEDAFMDMTHSQTINISRTTEHLTGAALQSCGGFPAEETNVLFHADNAAMGVTSKTNESCLFGSKALPTSRSAAPVSDIRSICSKVPSLDPGFENFLAGLFQSNCEGAAVTVADAAPEETLEPGLDKENQVPPSVRAVMEGSLSASRKRDASLPGGAMPDAAAASPDDCCSFPTKGAFPHFDPTSRQRGGRTAAARDEMKNPPHQRDAEAPDRTVVFSAGDEFMDMTQSHTVHIANQATDQSSSREQLRDTRSRPGPPVSGLDQGFKDFLAGFWKPEEPEKKCLHPQQSRPEAEDGRRDKTVRFSADDACMDLTQSHTVNIATHSVHAERGQLKNAATISRQQVDSILALPNDQVMESSETGGDGTKDEPVTPPAEEAFMDVTQSHAANTRRDLGSPRQHRGSSPAFGEKTVRFSADEAAMDMTQSLTVKIISDVAVHPRQNEQRAPPGAKTLAFPASGVAMDETRSYTVNIDTGFACQPAHNTDSRPAFGERTVRFPDNDAAMDVTRSHSVSAASDVAVRSTTREDGVASSGETTLRFTGCDAAMDVTESHTVNIACDFNVSSQRRSQCARPGEETVRFDDAATEETRGLAGNASAWVNPPPAQHRDLFPAFGERSGRLSARRADTEVTGSDPVDLGSGLEGVSVDAAPCQAVDLDVPSGQDSAPQSDAAQLSEGTVGALSQREDEKSPAAVRSNDAVDERGFPERVGPQNLSVDAEEEAQGRLVSPVTQTGLGCPALGLDAALTGALTRVLTDHHPGPDQPPQSASVNSCETESTCEEVAVQNPGFDAHLKEEIGPRKPTSPKSDGAADGEPSRKSRRMSLADLHTKIRRLSHMISAAPDAADTETQQEQDVGRSHQEKMDPDPAAAPDCGPALVNRGDAEQDQNHAEPTATAAETPFRLKTKQLMSRLSTGGFKAKLPQRSRASDGAATSAGEPTQTPAGAAAVTGQMSHFDANVSDINDEELDSCEDVSEALDTKSPSKARVKASPPGGSGVDAALEDHVFEDDPGEKSLFPTEEDDVESEKRAPGRGDGESSVTSAPSAASQTADESSSRCEATFESTFKQSLFESQLEDPASDVLKKFDDGTITVLEFFKLFNIDFVIHNPRQSVLPERLLSDTERTPLDSLRERHVHHPKHKVYEADVQSLSERVERLKERMHDLDKPLRTVNEALWEEMSGYTEKELKSFGAKLKERNNVFRKASKVRSHQMKEALYSDLLQAQQAEQQSLREKIERADEMIRSLDGCICGLEAELAEVVEKGCEASPSLNSLQQGMKRVAEALADKSRQISQLEVQVTQDSTKLQRLSAQSEHLEQHVAALHTMSEWRAGEPGGGSPLYTFLYNTFHLQPVYHTSSGPAAADEPERRISHIVFRHHFDEHKSQDHARIVHKLLAQWVQAEPDWVQKYPTAGHVPKLLRDVSLVVGHCRLLGEELRLLKMWGGLRLDILSIGCVDTLLHVVFSSLRKLAKFEVTFSVSLSGHHYVLRVHSFKNTIGDATLQRVQEIVASLVPGRNLLTKTVKKVVENLLR